MPGENPQPDHVTFGERLRVFLANVRSGNYTWVPEAEEEATNVVAEFKALLGLADRLSSPGEPLSGAAALEQEFTAAGFSTGGPTPRANPGETPASTGT